MQFSHSNANPQSKQLIKVEFIQIASQRITLISSSVLLDQVLFASCCFYSRNAIKGIPHICLYCQFYVTLLLRGVP